MCLREWSISPRIAIERSLCQSNQRFELAAVDLETGLMATHTDHDSQEILIPPHSHIVLMSSLGVGS